MPLLELRDVHKIYRTGRVEVHALKGIDIAVHRSDFIAIVGPSGSGKTTLLNIMGCIDLPTSGRVILERHEIHTKSPKELALLRRNYFGFIFQSFNLIPVLTVYENVELAINLKVKLPKSERRKRVMAILEAVGLADEHDRKPLELSGGQQQRVAIARALVQEPEFVIADEPTANLDSKTGAEIVELMRKLNEEKGVTFVFSTHDPLIMDMAHQVIRLRDGRIVES
ncbi:MAG: lipoprotein-releasing system ATP-binding protein LolD [Candidatus Hydrothermota bacterium]|nr:MAG: lipoprotein-releasing system ATP-binding protein LolD [Candidatus Hydrothermae bacterium]